MSASLAALSSPGGAQIAFSLSAPMAVDARVLNIVGRLIRTLCHARECESGTNTLLWNALSDLGLWVPHGTYLVEVIGESADGSQTRALTRVRVSG